MSTVIAPQYGRGISVLQEAQARRDQAQKEIAQKKRSDEQVQQALDAARRGRKERVEKAIQTIAALLSEEKYREAQQAALDEIHRLLGEFKMFSDERDRFWIAKKILHLTSWRGMKALSDVEEAFGSIFKDNIPNEIAEGLARLIDKQTEFLRKIEAKKSGVMRFGKTSRDRKNGALKQHEQNRARKASENRERAHSGNGGGSGKQKKQK